jgi:hypothetical protein
MAITASGVYGPSFEKMLLDTFAVTLASTAHSSLMVTDTYAPNFETHDFRDDITNEVSGGGYSAGGIALGATPTITLGSPSAGSIRWDFANPAWAASTITSAMAGITFHSTGTDSADELITLSDFVTAASTSNGLFTWTVHATDGALYFDYTP